MKVRDYVRSSWGTISRIKKYEHDEDGTGFSILIENECFGTHYKNKSQFDNDYKTSPKIIELLKVGDYVNGYRVIGFNYSVANTRIRIWVDTENEINYIFNNEIKSIVTKEQFSQMEYRIGE